MSLADKARKLPGVAAAGTGRQGPEGEYCRAGSDPYAEPPTGSLWCYAHLHDSL